jgi:hypothetical protein
MSAKCVSVCVGGAVSVPYHKSIKPKMQIHKNNSKLRVLEISMAHFMQKCFIYPFSHYLKQNNFSKKRN